jgi:D-serine deaminase-like pyridoxal phosphate-dependent protein
MAMAKTRLRMTPVFDHRSLNSSLLPPCAAPLSPFLCGEIFFDTLSRVQITDLPTPSILIDNPRVDRNVGRMQSAAAASGKRLRPHAKTHKSVAMARRQLERGASGICCAKLGEAEVFAAAGVRDIRLPYPLNPVNAPRVLDLLDRTRLSFIVDHPDVAAGWSEAMTAAGRDVDVLVKVDVGFHRCGIDPAREGAAEFVARVASMPGLRFRGLLSHAGHGYGATSDEHARSIATEEADLLRDLAARVERLGVEVAEISVGATPTVRQSLHEAAITELRPGNYIYFDRTQVALGAASWDDCALSVLARVVTAHDGRIILDSGSKTLTNDLARGFGATPGYGAVTRSLDSNAPDESLVIERLSEEHATVAVTGATRLRPGDLVRVIPNHSCVVSNLVDAAWLVDGERVLEKLEISARGRIA